MPTPSTGPPAASAAAATSRAASAIRAASNSTRPGAGVSGRTWTWCSCATVASGRTIAARTPDVPTSTTRTLPLTGSRPWRGPERRVQPELARVEDAVGIERLLQAAQNLESRAERPGQEAAPVEADPVVVADGGAVRERRVGDHVPAPPVVALAPLAVAVGAAPAEREVEAGAVDVGVRLVRRRRQRAIDALQRVDDLVVEGGERGPFARDLRRVHDHAGAPERGEGGDVVAVAEPAFDECGVEGPGAGRGAALSVDHSHGAG